jgi:DNA-binding PadR family transcriptional regulator
MSSIDQARELMEARLEELEQERKAIRDALAALNSRSHVSAPRRARRRKVARRAGRGERQAQFLNVVRRHPGEPISSIAGEMGVTPQQLYPIAHRLAERGEIVKRGDGYRATRGGSAKVATRRNANSTDGNSAGVATPGNSNAADGRSAGSPPRARAAALDGGSAT